MQTYKDGNPIPNSIKWKIDELHKRGFIQESARDILHQVREMGNASAHDIEKHDLRTIRSALETVELILYTIYELPNQKIYERKTKQNPEDMKGSNWSFEALSLFYKNLVRFWLLVEYFLSLSLKWF